MLYYHCKEYAFILCHMNGHKVNAALAQVNSQTKGFSLYQKFKYGSLTRVGCSVERIQYLL